MRSIKNNHNLVAALQGAAVVLTAVVLLFLTSMLQYSRMREMVTRSSYRRAQDNIDRVEQDFVRVVELVESAVRNNIWSARALVPVPDSLWSITRGVVLDNPIVYGSAIALVENYNPSKSGRLFAPYAYRDGDTIRSAQLGTEEYNYLEHEWFKGALEAGDAGYWSEPYYDEGGGNRLMITYSVPVRDHTGKLAAVITADVAMNWVSDRLASVDDYPGALKMLISQSGNIMATSPPYESMYRKSILDLSRDMDKASAFDTVNQDILAGKEGSRRVHIQGEDYYIFYDRMNKTGWSMSISIPEDEIFSEIRHLNQRMLGLELLGLMLLLVILLYTIFNQRKLLAVQEKKGRIESELHVASGIQESMLPKIFPPFPSRHDVDIYATLVSAKEVGGDLYDFFIRDERLYFCIGDVSGKGVPASLVMSVTRSLFRTVAGHEKSPVRIVANMNQNLVEMNINDMFVTFFCGVLDLASGHLRYCNAGHNAPVILSADASVVLPVVPNLPLGVMPSMSFTEQETDLTCGSGIFLYTDGLNEAEDQSNNQFGTERMMHELDHTLSANQQIERLAGAVRSFVGTAPQSDDLTMLYIRYLNDSPMEKKERHLILHNDIQQIPQLADFVETVGQLAGLSSSLTLSLNLALEEAVTNVILYAYPEGSDGLVDIEAIIHKDHLKFIISDSGKAFDPTAAPEVDITLDVEDRPIGGLGIFLVRNIMDSVQYERVDGKNILTMSKNLQ